MTSPTRLLPLLAFLLPLAAGAAEDPDPLGAIQSDLEAGRVDQALGALEAHLAANPGDPKARFIKGLALVRDGDEAAAIRVFQALAEDYPSLPEPHNNLAVLYASRGEYAEARDALRAAIRTHPSYATAHENLGDIYAKMAAEAYDKALSLDQRNRTAQAKLALVSELFSLPAPAPGAAQPVAAAMEPEPAPDGGPKVDASMESRGSGGEPAGEGDGDGPRVEEALERTVRAWADAWAGQRVADYLGHYARDFRPGDGLSREAWAEQRRRRLTNPGRIELVLDRLSFRVSGPGAAEARFLQTYRSDVYADRVNKVLELVREDGAWKIRRERSWPVAE